MWESYSKVGLGKTTAARVSPGSKDDSRDDGQGSSSGEIADIAIGCVVLRELVFGGIVWS